MIVISFKDFLHNFGGFSLIFSYWVNFGARKMFFILNYSEFNRKLIGIIIFMVYNGKSRAWTSVLMQFWSLLSILV